MKFRFKGSIIITYLIGIVFFRTLETQNRDLEVNTTEPVNNNNNGGTVHNNSNSGDEEMDPDEVWTKIEN